MRLSGARQVGLVSSCLFKEVARSTHRPRTHRAGVLGVMALDPPGAAVYSDVLTSLLSLGRVAAYCLAEDGHDLMVCPAGVKQAWWVSWCTPTGKKTSIDSLSYGNGHSELYPLRYN